MYIFVGNLPGKATLIDLQEFLGHHAMSVNFSAHCHPQNSDQHYVLIKTANDSEADLLVQELNGKQFQGSSVQARRCVQREQHDDWEGRERRFQQMDLDLLFSNQA